MGSIDIREIWVDPSWTYPPILVATLISSIVLAFISIRLARQLIWLRAQATRDRLGRCLVISLFPVSYIVIGFFQFWFGGLLYRDFSEIDSATNAQVGVPIFPVWLVGVLSIVIYFAIHRYRTRTKTARSRFGSESSR